MKSNYRAENEDGKLKSHSLLIDFIQDHLKCVVGATMPASSLKFEEKIINRTQWPVLDFAELDKSVYTKLVRKLKVNSYDNCTITTYCCDVIDMILKTKNVYNFIWLDYCGIFTEEIWNGWNKILNSKKLEKDCIIAITLSGRREHVANIDFYKAVVKEVLGKKYNFSKNQTNGINLSKFRNIDIPILLETAIINSGFNIATKPVHFSYKTPAPMKLYYYHLKRN